MNGTKTVALTIDGRAVTAVEGTAVLRAAEQAGIDIPHFCYHPAFAAEGNCRMCLVEIEGLPKLELACSTPVREGLVVRTATPSVEQARRDVLEFLLADHPLDCPICDKAGECMLQDQYDRYGRFPGRFVEAKQKKDKLVRIGRGLVLDRERCILCARCVRFLRNFTGTGELGVFERGARAEIGIFEGVPVDNAYAGNLVDICPVGAITAEDFRFRTRAWFLARKPSVCPHCSRGCAIVVESVAGYPLPEAKRRVYRVTAGQNPAVNGYWICDLGRAGRRDIDEGRPAGLLKKGVAVDGGPWQKALAEVTEAIKAVPGSDRLARIAVVLNARLTCEELARAKALFVTGLGLDKVSFADRKPGVADGLLLTAERVPNLRGVIDAGFETRAPSIDELAGMTVLLVFGSGLAAHFPEEAIGRALAAVPSKFLFAAHSSPLDRLFDLAFPVAVPAEKSGTYINVGGVRQSFERALEPPAGAVPEGEILTCLAHGLGFNLGDSGVC
jgi:NADH-quinone oxidoreductase subunit G